MPARTALPARAWRRLAGATAFAPVVVCAVLLATLGAALTMAEREDRATRRAQWAEARLAGETLTDATADVVNRLSDVGRAIGTTANADVTFDAMAGHIVGAEPVHAIALVERGPSRGRSRGAARGPGIRVIETRAVASAPRPRQQFPIVVTARRGLGAAQGTDEKTRFPGVRAALVAAGRDGRPHATPAVTRGDGEGPTMVVAIPAGWRPARFVTGLVRMRDVEARVRASLAGRGRFALFEGRARLGGDPGSMREPLARRVQIAGRTWTLLVGRPRPNLLRTLGVVVVGLLLALLAGLMGRRATRRQLAAESDRDAVLERSRHLAETAKEAEERFRTAFEEAPIGIAITGLDGRFQRVNRALGSILGLPREEIEGRPVTEFTHPEDQDASRAALEALIAGTTAAFRAEKRYLHAGGHPVWVALSVTVVRDGSGAPVHFLSHLQDITERRRHDAELRELADHDPLTGLLNRRSFGHRLEAHVAEVARHGARGAAMVLDLDHFKTINDTLGHGAGDELVGRVARALRDRLRTDDVLARLGGDEFAVLLPHADRTAAESVARDILAVVRGEAVTAGNGRPRRTTASIGIALFDPAHDATGEAVLVAADLAMYAAKEAGRDRWAVAEGGAEAEPLGLRFSWADLIRDALAEDRFVLLAQPIVDLDTRRTGQYELLLRMLDPDGALIAPGAFLPVAERYDLMRDIDRWVVRRAIGMLAECSAQGHDITVEVNLSGRSAGDETLLALIEAQLRATGVDPARLILEVTETEAVEDIARARRFATRLAELGCRFALDDFGAGFGSFYYLKHLPFDYLKIDGEFVRNCTRDPGDRVVIQALVQVARGMGKRTVAEQAGDAETVTLLRELGVDQAQGYHLGRPAPLADWLRLEAQPAGRGHATI